MTEAEIIAGVLAREQGYADHPHDRGGPTMFGITSATLGAWRKYGRAATRDEVQALRVEEARAIYYHQFVSAPGFVAITYAPLRAQVIDDGVMSGPHQATKTLQAALGVTVDGIFGTETVAAMEVHDPVAVHVRYLKARLTRYATIVRDDRTQGAFIRGWVSRALGFIDDQGRPCA